MSQAADLRAALRALGPHGAGLAALASLAAQVEPELLRALRLEVLPADADAGAEADVWWSAAVDVRGGGAITFAPEALVVLREDLVSRSDVAAARAVTRRLHRATSPLLRVEELVTWRALVGDTRNVDRLLRPLADAVLHDAARRDLITAWAAQALPRLPPAAQRARAYWVLLFVAQTRSPGTVIDVEVAVDPAVAATLDALPAEIFAGVTDAFVEIERRGSSLWLRRAAAAGPGRLACPGLEPLVVAVDGVRHAVGEEWSEAPVTREVPRITVLDGRAYDVVPRTAPAAQITPVDEWAACCKVEAGERQVSGYLVEPALVVTVLVDPPTAVEVAIAGTRRRGLVVRQEAGITLVRLATPVLGVTPLRLEPRSGSLRWRGAGHFTSGRVELSGGVLEASGRWLPRWLSISVDQVVEMTALAGIPLVVEGMVVAHIESLNVVQEVMRPDDSHLRVPSEEQLLAVPAARTIEALGKLRTARGVLDALAQRLERAIGAVGTTTAFHEQLGAALDELKAITSDPPPGELLSLATSGDGGRALALALFRRRPTPAVARLVFDAIECRHSAFEQRLALELAEASLGGSPRSIDPENLAGAIRAARRGPESTLDSSDAALVKLAERVETLLIDAASPPSHAPWNTAAFLDPGNSGIYAPAAYERIADWIAGWPPLVLISGGTALGRATVLRRWIATHADRARPLVAWSFEENDETFDRFVTGAARTLGTTPELEAIAQAVEEQDAALILEGVDRLQQERVEETVRLGVAVSRGRAGKVFLTSRAALGVSTDSAAHLDLDAAELPRDPALVDVLATAGTDELALVTRLWSFGNDVPIVAASAAALAAFGNGVLHLAGVRRWLDAPFASAWDAVAGLAALPPVEDPALAQLIRAAAETVQGAPVRIRSARVVETVQRAIAIVGREAVMQAVARELLGPAAAAPRVDDEASPWLLHLEAPLAATDSIGARDALRRLAHHEQLEAYRDPTDEATLVLAGASAAIERILDAFRDGSLTELKARQVVWIAQRRGDQPLPGGWGRRLSAVVRPAEGGGRYLVSVVVVATDRSRPLTEPVRFVWSGGDEEAVTVVGRAALQLVVPGATIVQAWIDRRRFLRLDLANVRGASAAFIGAGNPPGPPGIVISHAAEDRAVALGFASVLNEAGLSTSLVDGRMKAGEYAGCRVLVVVLSRHAAASESSSAESAPAIARARAGALRILLVAIDDVQPGAGPFSLFPEWQWLRLPEGLPTLELIETVREGLRDQPATKWVLVTGQSQGTLPWRVAETARAVARRLAERGHGLVVGITLGVAREAALELVKSLAPDTDPATRLRFGVAPRLPTSDVESLGGSVLRLESDVPAELVRHAAAVIVLPGGGTTQAVHEAAVARGIPAFVVPENTSDDPAHIADEALRFVEAETRRAQGAAAE